jgi:hypothetical protein
LVGRLNIAADRALSIAIRGLACCVSSIFSKYTSVPFVSTIAAAMAQLFARASASASDAARFACSVVMCGP